LQNGIITNAKLSTTTGELGGAWKSWTPTFTNWTIGTGGNAGTNAYYLQIGKLIVFRLTSTLGTSGFSVGTGVTFTVPVTRRAYGITGTAALQFGVGRAEDTGVANVSIFASGNDIDLDKLSVELQTTSGTYVSNAGITATVPWTWGAGDSINLQGFYEAA